MGKHRYEDAEEFKRRNRKAVITVGKRPKLTRSDTDEQKKINSKLRFGIYSK